MPKEVNLTKAAKYYQIGPTPIRDVVETELRTTKGLILHGGQAINAQLPDHLDRHTEDWDIVAESNAKAIAARIEAALDARYEENFFEVRPSRHPGTYRVINRVTKQPVVDITIRDEEIPIVQGLDGINYATLDHHARKCREILADPNKKFRWPKDSETLQRIEIYKKEQRDNYA